MTIKMMATLHSAKHSRPTSLTSHRLVSHERWLHGFQRRRPEVGAGEVFAEGLLHDLFAGGAAGEAEEGLVAGQEGRALGFEAGEECLTQQVAEDIREVVEADAADDPKGHPG